MLLVKPKQEAAVEAWKEACSMRRSGREPSRLDLASHFASALLAAEAAEEDSSPHVPGKVGHGGCAHACMQPGCEPPLT